MSCCCGSAQLLPLLLLLCRCRCVPLHAGHPPESGCALLCVLNTGCGTEHGRQPTSCLLLPCNLNMLCCSLTNGRPEDNKQITPVISESSANFIEGLVS